MNKQVKRTFKKDTRFATIDLYVDVETFEVSNPKFGEPKIRPYLIGCLASYKIVPVAEGKRFVKCFKEFRFFIAYLKSLYQFTNDLVIGSHNAKYDFTSLAYDLEKSLGMECINAKFAENGDIIHIIINHKELYCEWRCTYRGNKNIGSLKGVMKKYFPYLGEPEVCHGKIDAKGIGDFLFYSLRGETETFGVPREIEEDYLRRDVLGLALYHRKMIVMFVNQVWHHLKLKRESEIIYRRRSPLSLGGLSKKLMVAYIDQKCETLTKRDIFIPFLYNKEGFTRLKRGNCGGFVSVNKNIREYKCKPGEVVVTFDITSFYPSILKDFVPVVGEKPLELIKTMEGEGVIPISGIDYELPNPIEWKSELEHFGCPPITQIKAGEIITIPEEGAKDLDKYLKVAGKAVRQFYTPAARVFTDLVNSLYDYRLKHKGTPAELSIKCVMNSMYGKLSEVTKQAFYMYYKKPGEPFAFHRHERSLGKFDYSYIGSYIASIGRKILIETIYKEEENGNTFLCCDTDSVTMVVRNKPKFKLESGLGRWRVVFMGDTFRTSGILKRYMILNTLGDKLTNGTAMEGIPIPKGERRVVGGGIPDGQAIFETLDNETLSRIMSDEENIAIKGIHRKSVMSGGQILISDGCFETNSKLGRITGELIYNRKEGTMTYRQA